jgi:uncharacterized protein
LGIEQNKTAAMEFLTALAEGRGREAVRLLDDDATWWINGTTRFSGTYRIAQFLDLVHGLFETAEGPARTTFDAVVAEKNCVCIEARDRVRFADGRIYDNRIHYLIAFRGGKIAAIRQYLDTDHVVRLFDSNEGVSVPPV